MPEQLPGCAFPSRHIVGSLASKLPSTIAATTTPLPVAAVAAPATTAATHASILRSSALNYIYVITLGYSNYRVRLPKRRLLFQPSHVHVVCVFSVFCPSASFFDISRSCNELLRFVKV